jgi:ribosomal protein S18 acetylase RimI-like enzyme
MNIVEMTMEHYEAVLALMRQTPGVSIREADSREATQQYLVRNPGLSFVALKHGQLIGCAMCGHDGRRGYLQHVVVAVPFRGQGVAHQLVTRCLDQLETIGIYKTHLDVFGTNEEACRYWTRRGWQQRNDLCRYSFNRSRSANA